MKKLKIAIYSGIIPSTTFIENLIHAIAGEGHEVYLFGVKKGVVSYKEPGIHLFPQPAMKGTLIFYVILHRFLLKLRAPALYSELKAVIESRVINRGHPWLLWAKYLPVIINKPDIFHMQWAKGVEEWMFLKELLGVKIVLSLRGAHITYSPLADTAVAESYKRCFPRIDGFHAVSKEISYEAGRFGANQEKIKVVYSAVDTNTVSKYEKSFEPGTIDEIQLISVGRMHWIKGYNYSLDAVRLLIDKNIRIKYTIIGWGNKEELLYQVKDLGLDDHVILGNRIAHEQVLDKMQSSDLLLLPSVEEGIANVVLEAMAIGLPVLSSDCGGMKEIIRHGENGYLYHNRNKTDLADKIIHWMKEPVNNKERIRRQAKVDIMKNHSISKMGAEMSSFYLNLGQPDQVI